MIQHFFVHGLFLGSREIPNFFRSPFGPERQRSYAYYCDRCGEVWAKLEAQGAERYWPVTRPCEKHGDGTLAVSRTDEYWIPQQFTNDWPPEAVVWEFNCLLAQVMKEIEK